METKKSATPLLDGLLAPMIGLGIAGALGGLMGKMFGLNDEKTPQKLAEEMMAGAVRGILEHFEYKLDNQKREIERLIEDKTKLQDELDILKQQREDKEKLSKTAKSR